MAEHEEQSLEFTSNWRIAVVFCVLVTISTVIGEGIRRVGKILEKRELKAYHKSFDKMKEELMLLGFISLFLPIFQGPINHICIPKSTTETLLPCDKHVEGHVDMKRLALEAGLYSRKWFSTLASTRQLLSTLDSAGHCEERGMEPFLSIEGMHQLDLLVFFLAIFHMLFGVFTMLLGNLKMCAWKSWEEEFRKPPHNTGENAKKYTLVIEHSFVKRHSPYPWQMSTIKSWMDAFYKQFYGSMSKSDYKTLRFGFIKNHFGDKDFNFCNYVVRCLQDEFTQVVGVRWYLWLFVAMCLVLNKNGWHIFFWISFAPVIIVLALGTKLEHIKIQLAQEFGEKHIAVKGSGLDVRPSEHHFWFRRPQLVLDVIQFIVFQNAFEFALFFWVLATYGFRSCIMGKVGYIIPRLVIATLVQILCGYFTLPQYALHSHMGGSLNKIIFTDRVYNRLMKWYERSKMRTSKQGVNPGNSVKVTKFTVRVHNRLMKWCERSKTMSKQAANPGISDKDVEMLETADVLKGNHE